MNNNISNKYKLKRKSGLKVILETLSLVYDYEEYGGRAMRRGRWGGGRWTGGRHGGREKVMR